MVADIQTSRPYNISETREESIRFATIAAFSSVAVAIVFAFFSMAMTLSDVSSVVPVLGWVATGFMLLMAALCTVMGVAFSATLVSNEERREREELKNVRHAAQQRSKEAEKAAESARKESSRKRRPQEPRRPQSHKRDANKRGLKDRASKRGKKPVETHIPPVAGTSTPTSDPSPTEHLSDFFDVPMEPSEPVGSVAETLRESWIPAEPEFYEPEPVDGPVTPEWREVSDSIEVEDVAAEERTVKENSVSEELIVVEDVQVEDDTVEDFVEEPVVDEVDERSTEELQFVGLESELDVEPVELIDPVSVTREEFEHVEKQEETEVNSVLFDVTDPDVDIVEQADAVIEAIETEAPTPESPFPKERRGPAAAMGLGGGWWGANEDDVIEERVISSTGEAPTWAAVDLFKEGLGEPEWVVERANASAFNPVDTGELEQWPPPGTRSEKDDEPWWDENEGSSTSETL